MTTVLSNKTRDDGARGSKIVQNYIRLFMDDPLIFVALEQFFYKLIIVLNIVF